MKRLFTSLLLLFLVLPSMEGAGWITDLEAAKRKARASKKAIMINFTGSDWCGWCIKLKKEIFATREFRAYANANLILVETDFPKRKSLSSSQKAANQQLANQYGIRGFPTLVLLNSKGTEIGRMGYMRGGPKPFVERLKMVTGNTKPGKAGGSDSAFVPGPSPQAVETEPKPGLNLDGVSGRKGRRFAIINNQTFTKGQVGKIKLDGNPVQVKCLEITKDTATVQLENEEKPRQIALRQKK